MTSSGQPENPFAPPTVPVTLAPPPVPPGPTNYDAVPWYRRNAYSSGIILAHLIVMFLGGCIPGVGLLGFLTTIGVIAVCVVVLTGPIYYNKRGADGTLKTWSGANKVAAVILLVLFVAGYIVYFLYLMPLFLGATRGR